MNEDLFLETVKIVSCITSDNIGSDNTLYIDKQILAETVGYPKVVVNKVLKKLKSINFLRKVEGSLYMINPEFYCKSSNLIGTDYFELIDKFYEVK
jgi:hypothetical protein